MSHRHPCSHGTFDYLSFFTNWMDASVISEMTASLAADQIVTAPVAAPRQVTPPNAKSRTPSPSTSLIMHPHTPTPDTSSFPRIDVVTCGSPFALASTYWLGSQNTCRTAVSRAGQTQEHGPESLV